MNSVFKSLEETLEKYAMTLKESLAPPLTNTYINSLCKKLEINEPVITELYSWRNGTTEDKCRHILQYDICSFGKILPFGNAISIYMANKAEPFWPKTLFPILTTNAGEFLLFDFNKKSKTYGMILIYSAELLITKAESIYDSLKHLFETVIACYENEIYKFNSTNNILEIDFELESKLSGEKNIKSKYWTE